MAERITSVMRDSSLARQYLASYSNECVHYSLAQFVKDAVRDLVFDIVKSHLCGAAIRPRYDSRLSERFYHRARCRRTVAPLIGKPFAVFAGHDFDRAQSRRLAPDDYPSAKPVRRSTTLLKSSVTVTKSPLAKVMIVPPFVCGNGLLMKVSTCRGLTQRE